MMSMDQELSCILVKILEDIQMENFLQYKVKFWLFWGLNRDHRVILSCSLHDSHLIISSWS